MKRLSTKDGARNPNCKPDFPKTLEVANQKTKCKPKLNQVAPNQTSQHQRRCHKPKPLNHIPKKPQKAQAVLNHTEDLHKVIIIQL